MTTSVIGNATAAVTIGLNVFDSYIQELHAIGAFNTSTTMPSGTPFENIEVDIDFDPAPRFELATDDNGDLYTRLLVQGTATPQAGFPVPALPFSVALRVEFALDPEATMSDIPVLVLEYRGVDGDPSAPLTAEQVNELIVSSGIAGMLGTRIDSLLPVMVGALETELFDSDKIPSRASWTYRLELRKSWRPTRNDALAVFLGAPLSMNERPLPLTTHPNTPRGRSSFLPHDLGFGVVLGHTGMNRIFRKRANECIGTEINDATIRELDMTLDVTRIQVRGRGTGTGFEVSWHGPVFAELRRDSEEWSVDSSGVVTDVDRDWWVVFLEWGGLGILSIPFMIYVEVEVSGAPGEVRSGVSDIMEQGLAVLCEALSMEFKNSKLIVKSTENEGRIINNALNVFANVLIDTVIPDVRGEWHSNIGLTFDITQPSLDENAFSWTTRERQMPGRGVVAGAWTRISWTDFGQQFNAMGTIEVDAQGIATKIHLKNGLILAREPLPFDPRVVAIIPDVRVTWHSNIGLIFDFTQDPHHGDTFTWTVRQRPMPGRGAIAGYGLTVSWTDVGKQYNAIGVIEVDTDGRATEITLSNGVILTRPPDEPPIRDISPHRPDVGGVWHSNIGLVFEFIQDSQNAGMFTWSVRQRPMPGRGTVAGFGLTVSWTDFAHQSHAIGVIEVNTEGWATKIALGNGVILTRPPNE